MSAIISSSAQIINPLEDYHAGPSIVELLPKIYSQVPVGITFEDDMWDILPWENRTGNSRVWNIDFGVFQNKRLKDLAKVFVLYSRLTKNVGGRAAYFYIYVIKYLDQAIWQKDPKKLVNADFFRTESLLKDALDHGTVMRSCHILLNFGQWLNMRIGIPISYIPTMKEVYRHGRKGTEEGREDKLISTIVVRDMVEAALRSDISEKDKFYLSAFVILVATGFRINELATLRKNCLEEIEGSYRIHYFGEKVRRLEVRDIPQDMVPAVKSAIDYIISITEPGRDMVRKLKAEPTLDWFNILEDPKATEYFIGKYAHEWTADPNHRLINPDGAWLNKEQRYVDVISLVEAEGTKSAAALKLGVTRNTLYGMLVAQENSRKGLLPNCIDGRGVATRTSWDTDSRVVSALKFFDYCGISLKGGKIERVRHLLDEAQRVQLAGKISPCPPYDEELETKYRRIVRPVVTDKNGTSRLEPEDALFVLPRYQNSDARGTKEDYRLITGKSIGRWFSGENRSHGTGNHEDSCFKRLGIVDPKTGETASFTSHDIRHWLDTTYAEGHMPEETIAIIFNRKISSNHVYDQTSKKKRLENIRQAVRDGKSMGHISENYNRLAEYSRDEAEQYLIANTLMVNIMPHGVCTLSWGMNACPNYLSCFTGKTDSGVCECFQIDLSDKTQLFELQRIERELAATICQMPPSSPQYEHMRLIQCNIEELLAPQPEVLHATR